ncbi:MAG: energy transducer TonB [Cephaloticoccus sp.]|nr:energy transducer TonB [Cephaloticoccus sp.]
MISVISQRFFTFLLCIFLIAASNAPARTGVPAGSIEGIDIIETEPADFPRNLVNAGITHGWTNVIVGIDEHGELYDILVIGYSLPAFAQSAFAALHKWDFKPARINGKPVTTVIQLNFTFDHANNGVKVVTFQTLDFTHHMGNTESEGVEKLFRLDELDQIPVPVHLVSPAYSAEDMRRNAGKKVTVSFYIDESGNVRLPTLTYADDEEIARKALAAVAQWQFEPPAYRGKPVITKASQEFLFTAKDK